MQNTTATQPVSLRRHENEVVTAFFDRAEYANAAYLELQSEGIAAQDITVAANQSLAERDLAITEASKAPEGGVTGAAVGASVGAIAGALAIVGSVLLPGIGWLAGPIVGALAGAGAGGAAGGLVGALVGAGLPEHEAKVVEDTVRQGGVVLAVHVDQHHISRVRDVLKRHQGRGLAQT